MQAAIGQMNLSAREARQVLKLARMIADLAGNQHIELAYPTEALQLKLQ